MRLIYRLYNENGNDYRFNISSFGPIVRLAKIGGWLPAGTLYYNDDGSLDTDWDGGYFTNDQQIVTAKDAAAWADALEKMLDDIPEKSTSPRHTVWSKGFEDDAFVKQYITVQESKRQELGLTPDEPITWLRPSQYESGMTPPTFLFETPDDYYDPSPLDYWSGEREYIEGFIAFCRSGSFRIDRIVSPQDVAESLATKMTYSTGILSPNTLAIVQEATTRTVIEYRPPQRTGFWLDGSDEPVRVPLPGLIMVRSIAAGKPPEYTIFAVTKRPTEKKEQLYVAPIPNVYSSGSICWGNVERLPEKALHPVSLEEDWKMLFSSRFNDHGVGGKSQSHKDDIRKKYIEMEQKKTRRWPVKDMIASGKVFSWLLAGEESHG